jgi:general secretion pathway protein K
MKQPKHPHLRRLKKRQRRADERGIALILVLGAITVLTVFLTQLQEDTSSELASALAERDALKAEYFARSAVNLSRMLIATEPTVKQTVAPIFMLMNQKPPQIPVWEFTDLVLGPFNDAASAQGFLASIGGDASTAKNIGLTGGGHFEVTIVDEDAKINLNLAAQNLPEPQLRLASQLMGLMAPVADNSLFEQRDGDGQFSDRLTVCSALIDWADSEANGNETQANCDTHSTTASSTGPEDSFYQTIGLPYRRKNAAYDSLDEVRLVRGVSDDFWATFVDPEPDNPKKRIFTVWGQGTLNVNAANAQTMLALVCGQSFPQDQPAALCNDINQMQAFIMGVTLGKSMTMGLPLFGSRKDFTGMFQGGSTPLATVLQGLGVQPVKFKREKDVQSAIALSSKRFSIYADGIVPGYKRTTKVRIHAVLDFRDAGGIGPMGSIVVGGGQAAANAASLAAANPGGTGTGGLPSTGTTTGGSSASSGTQPGSPDAILAQLNSNPAGTVIYWRVE